VLLFWGAFIHYSLAADSDVWSLAPIPAAVSLLLGLMLVLYGYVKFHWGQSVFFYPLVLGLPVVLFLCKYILSGWLALVLALLVAGWFALSQWQLIGSPARRILRVSAVFLFALPLFVFLGRDNEQFENHIPGLEAYSDKPTQRPAL